MNSPSYTYRGNPYSVRLYKDGQYIECIESPNRTALRDAQRRAVELEKLDKDKPVRKPIPRGGMVRAKRKG